MRSSTMRASWLPILVAAGIAAIVSLPARSSSAHCDTMDGPVVKAGQKALETGEIDHALVWVKPEAEREVRAAFTQALEVRKLGAPARDLADRYFLETLVRLHRAGEGAPYTGLEPSGTDLGPAIPAADRALESGSTRAVTKLLVDAQRAGLKQRFDKVLATRKYSVHDVAAGREHVEAYVLYIHYVERLYEAATSPVRGHYGGDGETETR